MLGGPGHLVFDISSASMVTTVALDLQVLQVRKSNKEDFTKRTLV